MDTTHEIDFVLAEGNAITDSTEVKQFDPAVAPYFHRIAEQFPQNNAVQIVAELHRETQSGKVEVTAAALWLAELVA